jgi:hypothetical protein
MKTQSNMISQKVWTLVIYSKDNEVDEMLNKENLNDAKE